MISLLRQGGWLVHRMSGGMPTIPLTISSNQGSVYNIYTAAGSPAIPCIVIVTINTSIQLQAGLNTGSAWATGTIIQIANSGIIAGIAGSGGDGAAAIGSLFNNGSNGNNGGHAIILGWNLTINNTAGYIFGGGGGGGGGGAVAASNPPLTNQSGGGGGGGGGQGYNNAIGGTAGGCNGSPGVNGTAGSSGGPGGGGSGGTSGIGSGASGAVGGNWGDAGTAGDNSSVPGRENSFGGFGGVAGRAVQLNGFTLTQAGGFNGTQVKGLYT